MTQGRGEIERYRYAQKGRERNVIGFLNRHVSDIYTFAGDEGSVSN